MYPPNLGMAAAYIPPAVLHAQAAGGLPMFPTNFKEALDSMPFSVQAAVSLAFLFGIVVFILGCVKWARTKEGPPRSSADMFLTATGIMDMTPVRDIGTKLGALCEHTATIAFEMSAIKVLLEEREDREAKHHAREEDRKDLLGTMEKLLDERLKQAGEAVKGVTSKPIRR